MKYLIASIIIITHALIIPAIPPPACFANFRGEDCGKEPQHVIYYWKPGSRCEVGIWRGCLPNINMFKDQYECVSTCIFTVRAQPLDYHQLNAEMLEDYEETTTLTTFTTESIANDTGATGGTGEDGATGGEEGDATGGGEGEGEGEGEGGGEAGEEGEGEGEGEAGEEEPPPEK